MTKSKSLQDEVQVDELDKDQLEELARLRFGIDLDKRARIADLRAQVQALIESDNEVQGIMIEPEDDDEAPAGKGKVLRLKHRVSGLLFEPAQRLMRSPDLYPVYVTPQQAGLVK